MENYLSNISALNELCHTCKYNYYNTFNDHTALILAAQTGHSHCVIVIIEAGADVNARNALGETALMYAARNGDGDCVNILLKLGADVKLVNFNVENAMTYAVGGSYDHCRRLREQFPTMTMENHNASVHALLKAGADINTALQDGFTLLMGAAQRGCGLCVDFLTQAGATVNFRNTSGETALMYAAREGGGDCVRILLESGADVNIVSYNGENVISYALRSHYDGCFLLKDNFPGMTIENHNASVYALVRAGADVNTSEQDGSTLLMRAAQRGCKSCVKFLIQAGADVNMCRNDGYSALIYAVMSNCHCCVCFLIEAGADVNTAEQDGSTLLMRAVKRGCKSCVKVLIQAGADVNICRNDGCSALILAVMSNCHCCVCFLIEAGADVNVKCSNGDTALIVASRQTKSTKVLKLLTNAGADASAVITKRIGIITPLMLTVEHISNPTLLQQAKILLKAGARINVSDQYSYNALELYISTHRQWLVPDRTMVLLLQAAGESSHRMTKSLIHVPSYFREVDINLKQFCRDRIRKHLLDLNSEQNLFYRVPRLGLPKILSQYVLYDVCIDDD